MYSIPTASSNSIESAGDIVPDLTSGMSALCIEIVDRDPINNESNAEAGPIRLIDLPASLLYHILDRQQDAQTIFIYSSVNRQIRKMCLEIIGKRSLTNTRLISNAASWGQLTALKTMVEYGADVSCASWFGRTILHIACIKNHTHIIKYLIEESVVDINAADSWSDTPLHQAAQSGHVEAIMLLAAGGAELDSRGHEYSTPLHVACISNKSDAAECLIRLGADIDARDEFNESPLEVAARHGHIGPVSVLLRYCLRRGYTNCIERTLENVAYDCHYTLVLLVLSHLKYCSDDGSINTTCLETAMHAAIYTATRSSGNNNLVSRDARNIISTLIKHGANPNAVMFQKTALMHAASGDNAVVSYDLTKLLLSYGANASLVGSASGCTAADYAEDNEEVLSLLLANDNGRLNRRA